MNRKITAIFTRDIIKIAVWKTWIHNRSGKQTVVFVFCCAACVFRLIEGERSWFVGFLAVCGALLLIINLADYWLDASRETAKFDRAETDATRQFAFTDANIKIISDSGQAEFAWKTIKKVWRYPTIWLILVRNEGFFTLPNANLDEELENFIIGKVRENGGKVV